MAPFQTYGYSPDRAHQVGAEIESSTPMVWVLTLFGALLPAVLLLLLVRSIGDKFEPGFGTAATITLGLGTIVLTFATEYFPTSPGDLCLRRVRGPLPRASAAPPRIWLVAAAGLLAGLAVNFEYPVALAGFVFAYALSRSAPHACRAAPVPVAAAILGTVPTWSSTSGPSTTRSTSPTPTRSPTPASAAIRSSA